MSCATASSPAISIADHGRDTPGTFLQGGNVARTNGILFWATVGFVVMGIVARVARFITGAPLWSDEQYLAAAFLDLGYVDMLGTLPRDQVAPVGVLWIGVAVVHRLSR